LEFQALTKKKKKKEGWSLIYLWEAVYVYYRPPPLTVKKSADGITEGFGLLRKFSRNPLFMASDLKNRPLLPTTP